MKRIVLLVVLIIATSSEAAQQYKVGDFADFTKSPTEHVFNVVERPFTVRSVKGVIAFSNGDLEPLPNVVFEIQGPGTEKRLRRSTTDKQGHFSIAHVPVGTYKFKATLNGYSSSVGTINVAREADKANLIQIEMTIGN
jgi:hypothetical protein